MRRLRRAVALVLALTMCALKLWAVRLQGPFTLERRARWLQSAGRRVLRSMGIRYTICGALPERGLVVSNHLSYLDILIYSAAMPCFFVSKIEINDWPYFGMAARAGATMFIDRSRRASAVQVARQLGERFSAGLPILLFPEGTSSNGLQVLPFHSTLFEPAVAHAEPVTAAAVRYVLEGDAEERDLCWYDDTLFLPHIWKTLGVAGFHAELRFEKPQVYANRRIAAAVTHAEVMAMRSLVSDEVVAGEAETA